MDDRERELQLARREGARIALERHAHLSPIGVEERAKTLFPIVKREPRVVKIGAISFRLLDGVMQFRTHSAWSNSGIYNVETVRTLADLIANPFTETHE